MYSLHDWLSPPQPGRNQCCQCIGLRAKKAILALTILSVVVSSAVLVYFLIEKLFIPMPQYVNGVLSVFEIVACLLLFATLCSQRSQFVIPLILAEVISLLVWMGYVVYYVVLIIRNKLAGEGGEVSSESIVVPGAPSFALGNTAGEPTSNSFHTKTIGHILLVISIHFFLLWIAGSIFQIYRGSRTDAPKDQGFFMPSTTPAHNVIVLEQPIEEAMYGKKRKSPA